MDHLKQLKAAVFTKQEILAKIYARAKDQSLADYVSSWDVPKAPESAGNFFSQVRKLLMRVYPALADDAVRQSSQSPLVSTVDHHGILNHPFFLNANLIYSQRKELKYLLCLSTAGISLNNSSWPGSLLLSRADGPTERLSFFRDKIKTRAVLAVKGFTLQDTARLESRIKRADFLSENNKRQLLGLMGEIFRDPKLFTFSDFSGQASFVSTALWQKVFPAAPKLLYLPLEKLVSELVINEIAPRAGHILYKLFFTQPGWVSVEKHFQGSLGAFSGSHKGSFLFWGTDHKSRRIHLARQNGLLADGNFTVPANAEFIANNLQTGSLYPTSLVCFLVLLYYGITCLGGFNQVNWLTGIKEKFIDLLKEWGEINLAARTALVPTENFAEGSLVFGLNRQGRIFKPGILDLFLQNDPGIYEKYGQLASQITLRQSIDAGLPEIYKVIVPAKAREKNFLDITENDILNSNGMAGKIKSALA